MEIVILCVAGILATFISWLYISNRKPTGSAPEATEESSLFKKTSGKQWIFLSIMLVGLCGLAVTLELVYVKNTLLDNLKLVTLMAILFTAAKIDAKEQVIPNKLVLAGLILRISFWVAELIVEPDDFLALVKDNIVACLLIGVFFIIGVLLVRGGLGMGDIKLMLVMSLFQGFYGVVSALFGALFVAFVYAVVVLLMKKKTRKDSVAFAPAILLGTMLSVLLTGM